MSITIVATAGASTANSFVTEAEQIAYMATRLNASAWTTVSGTTCTETEKAAMIEATRELSNRNWQGCRATETQALAWPRWDVINPDSPNTFYYQTTTVPQRVKDATMELAFQFLNAGTTDIASLDTSIGIKRKKVDVLETEYVDPSLRAQGLQRYPRVWALIRPLLMGAGNTVPVMRG